MVLFIYVSIYFDIIIIINNNNTDDYEAPLLPELYLNIKLTPSPMQ